MRFSFAARLSDANFLEASMQRQTSGITLIRRREVERRLGVSRSTIYDKLSPASPRHDPNFPKPVSLGGCGRSIGFVEAEVDEYIAALVDASRAV